MRIAIAGAGNVGRAIARELLDNGHQVLLIDKDPKAMKMQSVPDAEWLMADACEITSLDNAKLNNCQVLVAATGDDKVNLVASLLGKTEYGIPRVVARMNHPKNEWLLADACEITALDVAKLDGCQVLVAATGDDKVNLVASLLGKTEYGVPRVVARVNHPKNEWMFDSAWGVDVAVSTPRIISALVEEAVSVGDVVRLFSFRKGEANLVEITLPDTAACCGKL